MMKKAAIFAVVYVLTLLFFWAALDPMGPS